MRAGRRGGAVAIKRSIDVLGAGLGLVVFSPVIVVSAALVIRRYGRPALFHHERAGRNAVRIVVPKLRTMTDERDERGALVSDEVRLTELGRRLRSASLDELPQLWSVLKGDMSLVGPRPLPLTYVERYSDQQRRRLAVRPGMTGWAQIHGRNTLSWPAKLEMDVWYVDNASIRLDIKILVLTIAAVVRRQGVSAADHATMHEFMGET